MAQIHPFSLEKTQKYKLQWPVAIAQILLKKRRVQKKTLQFPIFHLLHLIQKATKSLSPADFRLAIEFSKKKGLFGFFQRVIGFFPDPLIANLGKGRDTSLPRAILRLLIFDKTVPVYSLKFLGRMIVYKNQRYLRASLQPKEEAFLINIALRIGRPGMSISFNELRRNFWNHSREPSLRCLHLLSAIKRKLWGCPFHC